MNSVQQLAREQAFYARRKFPVPAPSSARDRRSKDPNARYFHIYEGEELDEAQITRWVKQASRLPGWSKA